MTSSSTPRGWQLMPVDPTPEMEAAGWIDKEDVSPREIFWAMCEAAPPAPAQTAAPAVTGGPIKPGDPLLIRATATDDTAARLNLGQRASVPFGPGDVVASDPTSAAEVRAAAINAIDKAQQSWGQNSGRIADAILAHPILGPRLLGQQGGDAIEHDARVASQLDASGYEPGTDAWLECVMPAADPSPVQAGDRDGDLRDTIARFVYEAAPYCESGEYVDGFRVSQGGDLTWAQALARDAEFSGDPAMIPLTKDAFATADAILPIVSARLAAVQAERDRAVAVLRQIQWSAHGDGWPCCPICGGTEGSHSPCCELAAALASSTSVGTGEADTAAPGCDQCPDEAAVIDYFNEQGEQIDDEGSVMQHVSHRHSDEIAQLNREVAMLREALLGLNNALDAMWNDPLPRAKALEKHAKTITDWQQKAKKALTQEARKDA